MIVRQSKSPPQFSSPPKFGDRPGRPLGARRHRFPAGPIPAALIPAALIPAALIPAALIAAALGMVAATAGFGQVPGPPAGSAGVGGTADAGVANPGYYQPQGKIMGKIAPTRPAAADVALSAYVARVRADLHAEPATLGSLWIPNGKLTQLASDARARGLHDVISVVVSESLTAETDGTVKNQRASSMSSAVSSLFGTLGANNRLQNLLNTNAASALTAQGQSVSNSSLTTILGGEVVDVLPNGMLVIQAVRQVSFSQQTQTIRLRGVVRPEDVSSLNQVPSAAITNLELEVLGKGIINDSTYRPNLLVRLVQRLLVF